MSQDTGYIARHRSMPQVGERVLHRYEVLQLLGEGGFGAVYLAKDLEAGGQVALKMLDPEKSSHPDFVDRFRQEVMTTRSLRHPNTVKVYDLDVTPRGCHFMVMEYLEGKTLDRVIASDGALPLGRTVRIFRQVLGSLAEAHSMGVIHRDLKPPNIMVCQLPGESDSVKVLDFGIAKVFGELAQVKTRTGLVMCTTRYAAPELLRGAKDLSPAVDIYALGLILIEALTGVPAVPYDSDADIIVAQLSPTPHAVPDSVLSTSLGPIVARAIDKDPAKRFQDAHAMIEALNAAGVSEALPSETAKTYEMPAVGDLVKGRYRVEKLLGKGGFSSVFLVRDEQAQGQLALKIINPGQTNLVDAESRFRQEVALVRQLNHPNAIKIWDIGTTETGCLYMAMEYVIGTPLDDILRQEGPLSAPRVMVIARQILKVLCEAHDKGIIHRDLKPANIFVCQLKGDPDHTKVLDFGIAKAIEPKLQMVQTQDGMVLCTPTYAAPELLKKLETVPATDLYALGLIMLEMLTGNAVVTGNTPYEVAIKQLLDTPNSVPEPFASTPLGPVIQKALEKDLARRYSTAEEMLTDLNQAGRHMVSSLSVQMYAVSPAPAMRVATMDKVSATDETLAVDQGALMVEPSAQRKSLSKWVKLALVAAALVLVVVVIVLGTGLLDSDQPRQAALTNPDMGSYGSDTLIVDASGDTLEQLASGERSEASASRTDLVVSAGDATATGTAPPGSEEVVSSPEPAPEMTAGDGSILLRVEGEPPLYVARDEVSIGAMRGCLDDASCSAVVSGGFRDHGDSTTCRLGDDSTDVGGAMNCINQPSAQAYCQYHSMRLPSDEEVDRFITDSRFSSSLWQWTSTEVSDVQSKHVVRGGPAQLDGPDEIDRDSRRGQVRTAATAPYVGIRCVTSEE